MNAGLIYNYAQPETVIFKGRVLWYKGLCVQIVYLSLFNCWGGGGGKRDT